MTTSTGWATQPLLTIRPGATPVRQYLVDLWHHRDLLSVLAVRDVKLRYRQTALGIIWVVVQPILAAGILSFIFGRVAGLPADGVPFFLFSFAGMLGWNVFSTTLTRSSASLVAHAGLVAKIFFPRLILPLSTAAGALLDLAVTSLLLVGMLVVTGIWAGAAVLTAPIWLVLLLMLALGTGFLLSGIAVRYRDVGQITPVAVQFLLYISPIAYSAAAIPDRYQTLYHLNPVAGLVEGFRWSVVGSAAPQIGHVAYAAVLAVALFLTGALVLQRSEGRFADVV